MNFTIRDGCKKISEMGVGDALENMIRASFYLNKNDFTQVLLDLGTKPITYAWFAQRLQWVIDKSGQPDTIIPVDDFSDIVVGAWSTMYYDKIVKLGTYGNPYPFDTRIGIIGVGVDGKKGWVGSAPGQNSIMLFSQKETFIKNMDYLIGQKERGASVSKRIVILIGDERWIEGYDEKDLEYFDIEVLINQKEMESK